LDADTLLLAFQHAIDAAHKFGVSYLWIDNLCILQDSQKDFDREAGLMSKIFRNSHCTISADMADTVSLGVFRAENVERDSVEFQLISETGELKTVRAVKEQP
jgi:hypothetical protein